MHHSRGTPDLIIYVGIVVIEAVFALTSFFMPASMNVNCRRVPRRSINSLFTVVLSPFIPNIGKSTLA